MWQENELRIHDNGSALLSSGSSSGYILRDQLSYNVQILILIKINNYA